MKTLKNFLKNYDLPGSVLLLEGKRIVPEQDIPKLIKLGKILAEQSEHILFRSGNAPGADFYFSQGVTEIDNSLLHVITPYAGHRQKENKAYSTISLDDINLANEPEVVYQTTNKKNKILVDQYVSGKRDKFSIKAAYLLRDTIKVLGTETIPPASFAIFYDDLENPETGGTGHTMEVCRKNSINFINQSIWFNWLI